MQYMILFLEPAAEVAKRTQPEHAAQYWGGWNAYIGAMREAGVIVSGNALLPAETATTVRLHAGKRAVQDGPFADTKEQLGGYFILEVKDLDAALDWAARAPCAEAGAVEVRPVLVMNAPTA
jgi:hypothetical protein